MMAQCMKNTKVSHCVLSLDSRCVKYAFISWLDGAMSTLPVFA